MIDAGDLFSMKGKTVLITGAPGYLGKSMAFALAEFGAHILVNSRNRADAESLVDSLERHRYSAEPLVFDVTQDSERKEALKAIADKPLHVLINNAYAGDSGTILTADSNQYRNTYEVVLVAAQNLFKETLDGLRRGVEQSGDACVINVASMYGFVSPDIKMYDSFEQANPPFYGAAKAALIQWTRYAACEFGSQGIRVNCISPGAFPADKVKQAEPDFLSRLARRVPLGRVGASNEIRGPILFLASPAASYVNGTNLVVDGGWTAW